MSKIPAVLKASFVKRREFLFRTTALGSMMVIGTSAGSAHALGSVGCGLFNSSQALKQVSIQNATVNDFTDLVGQSFNLMSEDGTVIQSRLLEAKMSNIPSGLRFRRKHFSIVFDVPDGQPLVQGQYQLNHPQIASMDLFMVPVDMPTQHNRLEAIFS